MSVSALAYCVVSMVTAAFDAAYSGAINCDSARVSSWVRAADPTPLVTFTTTCASPRRRSGRNAEVTRTMLIVFVLNTRVASSPVSSSAAAMVPAMPALLIRTSMWPSCAATSAAAFAVDSSSATSMGTKRARSLAAAAKPWSRSRAPTSTVWPRSVRRRALSNPRPRLAPVMKMVFDMPSSLRRCSPTGQGGLFVGPAVPQRELRHRAQGQCACLRQPPRDDVACLAGPALTRSGRAAGAWAAALLGPAARGRGGTRRYFGRLRGQAGARPRDHAFRASGAGTGLCSAAERRGARPPVPARGAAGAAAQPGHRSDPGGNTTAADQAGRYSGRRLRRRLEPGVVEPALGRALRRPFPGRARGTQPGPAEVPGGGGSRQADELAGHPHQRRGGRPRARRGSAPSLRTLPRRPTTGGAGRPYTR